MAEGTSLWKALFLEKRLPWRYQKKLDVILKNIGWKHKIVSARGIKVKIRRDCCDSNFVTNVIEDKEYNPYSYEINKKDTVIDIGGNIGVFALWAAKCACEGKVYTFEPENENFSLLKYNIKLNNSNNIHPEKLGVYNKEGRIKFYLKSTFPGGHSIDKAESEENFTFVECTTLENVFKKHKINKCNFLKMDCEGAEFPIILNLSNKILNKIDKIAMEHHSIDRAPELVNYLKDKGFKIDRFVNHEKFSCGHIFARRS